MWIVLPHERCVKVVTSDGETEVGGEGSVPEPAGLPGLTPVVGGFFRQLA